MLALTFKLAFFTLRLNYEYGTAYFVRRNLGVDRLRVGE